MVVDFEDHSQPELHLRHYEWPSDRLAGSQAACSMISDPESDPDGSKRTDCQRMTEDRPDPS